MEGRSKIMAKEPRQSAVQAHAKRPADQQPSVSVPTTHYLHHGDARELSWIPDESVHLVVTSPPYWTLKKYGDHPDQLGAIGDYETFMDQLDRVWRHCYRVLVCGGRVVCVVGDVCLARRRNNGRHMVVPLHADVSVRCRRIGFDYLTPIFWNKTANASYEAANDSPFLGTPYQPNAIIKNDVEYILMLRKPGGYRTPTNDQRRLSRLTETECTALFCSFWLDLPGASTREHPAPYPVELAYRLVRMFSFTEDTVLDPFAGTCATSVAAMRASRNSIAIEIEARYLAVGERQLRAAAAELRGPSDQAARVTLVTKAENDRSAGERADSRLDPVAPTQRCPDRAQPA